MTVEDALELADRLQAQAEGCTALDHNLRDLLVSLGCSPAVLVQASAGIQDMRANFELAAHGLRSLAARIEE